MNREKLKAALVVDERKCPLIYEDSVGKITGGVGRNLSDKPFKENEIQLMLDNDINDAETDLDRNAPWWRSLTDARQNVLANMCFNMGWSKLSGFRLMLAAAKSGDYDKAATEMLDSTWAKQVHGRADRLAALMRKGEF